MTCPRSIKFALLGLICSWNAWGCGDRPQTPAPRGAPGTQAADSRAIAGPPPIRVNAADVAPLGGTSWTLQSVSPQPARPLRAMTIRFEPGGSAIVERTYEDGGTEKSQDRYQVIGSSLVVNRADPLLNARWKLTDDTLVLDSGTTQLTMGRLQP